jgi:hypothetical protein
MRKERAVGNLAVELGGPAAWNLRRATWTTAVSGESVIGNEISVALD